MTTTKRSFFFVALSALLLVVSTVGVPTNAQVRSSTSIAPAYEGWEQNDDGSFNLVFGYMNRNRNEGMDVPLGQDNRMEPGKPDRGQPTHFLPMRNRHVFRIHVPADFGDQEIVWTLVTNGQTERAYGTLHRDYFLNDIAIMNNNGAGGAGGGAYNINENKRPELVVVGEKTRQVKVGETSTLTAFASDDDVPAIRNMPAPRYSPGGQLRGTPNSASGLRVSWFVYRGSDEGVAIEPPQFEVWENYQSGSDSPWSPGWEVPPIPPQGKWVIDAAFDEPGTYVLRCLAHDGGLAAHEDITFTVTQ